MFGYRIRFQPHNMTTYMSYGHPSNIADQTHKPVHYYTKEKVLPCTERYDRIDGYASRQTIVRVLDSDNEEDLIEIEKNRKLIKYNNRCGLNTGNTDPRVRKI